MNQTSIQAIGIAAQVGIPFLIWGPPGIGKTSAIYDLFENGLKRPLKTIIASLRDPADFGGYPMLSDGTLVLAPPDWARWVAEMRAGVFIDEINTAPPAVQAALLRVILEKVVGDVQLPRDTPMGAAANPPDMAAGGWELPLPTANRFVHITPPVDAVTLSNTWCEGMLFGFPSSTPLIVPDNWETQFEKAMGLVIGFLKAFPQQALVIPQNQVSGEYAFPSPRTWEYVAKLVAACMAANAPKEVTSLLIVGAVGRGAGSSFINYISQLNLPNPETLLANPSSFTMPDRQDTLYVIFGSIASRVAADNTKERFEAAMRVAEIAVSKGAAIDILAGVLAKMLKAKPSGALVPPDLLRKLGPLLGFGGI